MLLDTEKMGKKEKNKKKGKGAEKTIEKTQKKLKSKVKKETGEDDIENIGQAHDMFSRIFRIRTYEFSEFFYQIFNLFVTSKNETINSPIHEFKVLQNIF